MRSKALGARNYFAPSRTRSCSQLVLNGRKRLILLCFITSCLSFYKLFHLQSEYFKLSFLALSAVYDESSPQFSEGQLGHNLKSISSATRSEADSSSSSSRPILYADATLESSKILLRAVQTLPDSHDDDIIDPIVEAERCRRYNLPYSNRTTRRRIFHGSSIADDSWDVIAAQAMETHGIFHTVAFIESNRTQAGMARELRFDEHSEGWDLLTQKHIFGKNTKVSVDYYINEPDNPSKFKLRPIQRDHDQRSLILQRWKQNGMKPDDIGYITDVDEGFSRDFLRAAQICDVKEFDPSRNGHGNCKEPKVWGGAVVFEGGPGCLTTKRSWHPDFIIGACIEGISTDAHLHPIPERAEGKTNQWMLLNYTHWENYSALPSNTTHYPLWNAADFRRTGSATTHAYNLKLSQPKNRREVDGMVQYAPFPGYVGYHLHNFFSSLHTLRFKYLSYGHPKGDAMEKQLSAIDQALESMVLCGFEKWDDGKGKQFSLIKNGTDLLRSLRVGDGDLGSGVGGVLVPLAFEVPGYEEARMKDLREMLESSMGQVRR